MCVCVCVCVCVCPHVSTNVWLHHYKEPNEEKATWGLGKNATWCSAQNIEAAPKKKKKDCNAIYLLYRKP